MTAARLRAGLHLIYLVAPLVRLGYTERSGCACSEKRVALIDRGDINGAQGFSILIIAIRGNLVAGRVQRFARAIKRR